MSDFASFFDDFPLTYLSRDKDLDECYAPISSITDLRINLLTRDKSVPAPSHILIENEETANNISMSPEAVYLNTIGDLPDDTTSLEIYQTHLNELMSQSLISPMLYGFLFEIDPTDMRRRIEIDEASIPNESHDKLFRFCYAHGVHPTHDISTQELQRMALWIIRNESDQISYTKMPEFMQMAIDLSVMTQNINKMSETLTKDSKLSAVIRQEINESEEKLALMQKVLYNSVELNKFLVTDGTTYPAMKFQEKALSSLAEPKQNTETAESEDQETADDEQH